MLPACGRTLALWARDGLLVPAGDPPGGGRLDGPPAVAADVLLPAGEWVLAVVHDVGGRYGAGTSQPFVLR